MNRLSAYRGARIYAEYADKFNPMMNSYLIGTDAEAEKTAARADIRALDCNRCTEAVCAYRDKASRLPTMLNDYGCCLRFARERLGVQGFFLPNGEPLLLTDEAIEAIRDALGLEG